MTGKIPPTPTPETAPFWEGTLLGELRLQRCDRCAEVYFPPRPFCPRCLSRSVSWFRASGRGRLYSYVINHRPRPDWPQQAHSVALVELAEGPRMVSNIVGVPQTPERLVLDMPLLVCFEPVSAQCALPVFRPLDTPTDVA